MSKARTETNKIDGARADSGSVLAVVVLYKRPFNAVPSAARLKAWLHSFEENSVRLHLARCLIYDNSPVMQPFDTELSHERMDVFHNSLNGGTRAAYLHAWSVATENGHPWILFLDHDTLLPENFFQAADHALSLLGQNQKACAVVPRVFDAVHPISPSRITTYGRGYPQQEAWGLVHHKTTLTAIASASLIRTDALARVLPIPEELVLDHLDHWLFRELQRTGEKLVVSSAEVEHSLSVQSMNSIGAERYRAILAAELVYLKSDPKYSFARHLMWHVLRTAKVTVSTKRYDLVRACVGGLLDIVRAKGGK